MFSFVAQEQTITSSTEKLVKFSREWFHNYSSSKPKDKLLLKQLMAFCLNYYFHQLLESVQDSVQENITFIVLITKKIIRQEILTRIIFAFSLVSVVFRWSYSKHFNTFYLDQFVTSLGYIPRFSSM